MSATPLTSAPAVRNPEVDQGLGTLSARRLWVWWHLLSLDAPTVAVVWCWFFAAAFRVSLPPTALVTLALGTWCVYVADRLLDGWRSVDMTDLRDRHWFYLRHRKPFRDCVDCGCHTIGLFDLVSSAASGADGRYRFVFDWHRLFSADPSSLPRRSLLERIIRRISFFDRDRSAHLDAPSGGPRTAAGGDMPRLELLAGSIA